jgi:GT2 family glycosyltransferase
MSASADRPLSVIVSTFEWPEALDVGLRALSEERGEFEIVVADDGSGSETRAVVERWRAKLGDRVVHAWQPDDGYRRARVLNLAASVASGSYLLILDSDCLVRRHSLTALRRAALPGWMLASKRLNMSPRLSRRVLEGRASVWRWSAAEWLVRAPRELVVAPRQIARPGLLLPLRDRRRPWRTGQPEFSPPYDGYGFYTGVWRDDLERVNGFDMRFVGWGGEDVDLALRLRRAGIKCGWPGPRATVLHLWHPLRKGTTSSNTRFVEETETSDRIEAVEGLRELAAGVDDQVNANRVGMSSSSIEPEKR